MNTKKTLFLIYSIFLYLTVCGCTSDVLGYEQPNARTKIIGASKQTVFCNAVNVSHPYRQKPVTITAVLYIPPKGEIRVDGASDTFLYWPACNSPDYFSSIDFLRTSRNPLVRSMFRRASKSSQASRFLITFTGNLSVNLIPRFGHLGWLRSQVKVDSIGILKVLPGSYPMPNFNADAPIGKAASSLKYLNADVLLSCFGLGLDLRRLDELLTDESVMFINGSVVKKDEIIGFLRNKEYLNLSVAIDDISRQHDIWTVEGIINVKLSQHDKVLSMHYKNSYIEKTNGSWNLRSLRIGVRE